MFTAEQRAEKMAQLDDNQKDLLQLFGWGTAGVVPGDKPGTWLVYDTGSSATFDFHPSEMFGPMTAFPVNLP